MARAAQIPALIRGGVAIAWFGIQTYLASKVLDVLLIMLFPGLESLTQQSLLGLPLLGWISFSILWAVQVVIACWGMESIRKYEAFAGPVIFMTFIALAGWILYTTGGKLHWSAPFAAVNGPVWVHVLGPPLCGWRCTALCAELLRLHARHDLAQGRCQGQLLGHSHQYDDLRHDRGDPDRGQLSIDGTLINNPIDVVQKIPNKPLLVMASFSLLILTIAVNLMANFVAPALALTNLAPSC